MPDRYRSVLLFGSPGVGKGMQGKLLGNVPGFVHLATGEIFRALDKQSPLGKKFVEYSSKGELVPDDVTIQLWLHHVQSMIHNGRYRPPLDVLVLDGMPRTLAQCIALEPHINVLGVVHLTASDVDVLVGRMKRRAEREGRHDDANEAIIRNRFQVYENETAPVLEHFDSSLVRRIDAQGTPAEVLMHVLHAIMPAYTANFENPMR
jgi:adenylate kinase